MLDSTRRYSGKLYYVGNEEFLDVAALIVREGEISFSLASVTEFGRWNAASGSIANIQPDGTFVAREIAMTNGVRSELWDIRFGIDFEEIGQAIELSGDVSRGAETYSFSGELEPL